MRHLNIIIFLIPFALLSQMENNFYLIINDSKMTSSDIKSMMNLIYLESDIKLNQFKVIHYTNKLENTENWVNKKKIVEYKPTKTGCDFNACESISAIISLVKTERTKFYMCEKQLKCDFQSFGIESSLLPNKNESTLINKIKEEITLNKSSKKKLTIFFYIENNQINYKPQINFESENIQIKDSESYTLNPQITGNVANYNWVPSDGLSCSDCKNPVVRIDNNKTYTLTVSDSMGCSSISKTINVTVEKSCLCDKDLQKTEILLGKLPIKKYKKRDPKKTAIWEWGIISNQSGGYVFDLVCKSVCAKKYKVVVRKSNGSPIYEDFYTIEEVDKRSRNDYHEKYPENFVFRLDLAELSDFLNDEEEYFTIEILSIDDSNLECFDKKYTSPKVRLTKCNYDD